MCTNSKKTLKIQNQKLNPTFQSNANVVVAKQSQQ